MDTTRSSVQLSMDFAAGENPLAQRLRQGDFALLLEYDPPLQKQPFDSAITVGLNMAKKASGDDLVAGILVTDRARGEKTHDAVETAARLAEHSGKPGILTIAGKAMDAAAMRDLTARARSAGIHTVFAVTGDRDHPRSDGRNGHRNGRGPTLYLDAVEMLCRLRTSGNGVLPGASINPFKYTPEDQYLQYYKMARKLQTGAEFLIAQTGWDMKKFQELQWYLQMREISAPVFARVALLSPDEIERIHDGLMPGVHVARTYAAMLQRESDLNPNQCLSAQLHRIGMQVAGCRLLGYSGIALHGIRDDQTLAMVLKQVREALDKYQNYKQWLGDWQQFHDTMEFSPIPDGYYVYRNLLDPDIQFYDPQRCVLTDRTLPEASRRDRIVGTAISALTSRHVPEPVTRLARTLLCRRCPQSEHRLRYIEYLCPHDCPKHLVFGACGGSYPDGTCEYGQGPCFFHRVLGLAAARQHLDRLEDGVTDV